jgi:hypothetical protein
MIRNMGLKHSSIHESLKKQADKFEQPGMSQDPYAESQNPQFNYEISTLGGGESLHSGQGDLSTVLGVIGKYAYILEGPEGLTIDIWPADKASEANNYLESNDLGEYDMPGWER